MKPIEPSMKRPVKQLVVLDDDDNYAADPAGHV
jgi:hypothetical protein